MRANLVPSGKLYKSYFYNTRMKAMWGIIPGFARFHAVTEL
jgi:hypothetical protein